MSDRHVKFNSTPKGYRSHEAHDSGVGSSSSEQASMGGRPDRRFTAEDYEDQLYSVAALQEALGQANKKVEQFQKKCIDLDNELTKAHRVARDTDKLYRDEFERNERLQKINKELEETRSAQEEQIMELKAAYNDMRDERDEYRQLYLSLTDPVIDITMRGGSGEPSSPKLRRSGSKRELKSSGRKYADHGEEKASSSRHHRRSSSISQPSTRSSSKKPYIEKMPPNSSSRYSGHYTIDTSDTLTDPALYSHVPRNTHSGTHSSYHGAKDFSATGNYVPYPLHQSHGEPRGRRRP
ncbi:hypothetical protein F4804DRAFT_30417 [Jackrogersella minutella]|nr:hypothetical protein F4804DRAFT_30417 [Jackrogersella minutella]